MRVSLKVMGVMDDRAEFLRRSIAGYRRRLAKGVPSETARVYLAEIAKAEAELSKMVEDRDERE